ncbi:hypothetical protein DPMN_008056 [Dreissena polymorpha]|uniref:Uncharacterized protein n=1 Tax=Dreissena polymorpha TaxID=45954 RepID=A0A9D4RWZ0_DREPO|nr:hypothetical protein DPMN_008056 [Dreissena polymorpha]
MLKLAQTNQPTDQPTDQQTGQKQYVPHYYSGGHKSKEYLSRHRQKKKLERELETARRDLDQPTPESSGYGTGRSESTPLVFDFQFPNKRNGPRRVSNALAKKQKELRRLKAENEEMRLKYQRTLRGLQRYKKAEKKTDESECSSQQENEESLNINKTLTPNSKTKRMMKMAKLSREQRSKVHKQLLFSFAVQNQMKTEKRGIKPTEKGSLRTHIGSILKKYGLKKTVSMNTGLSRNCLNGLSIRDITRRRETRTYNRQVIDFLSQDDNLRSKPWEER